MSSPLVPPSRPLPSRALRRGEGERESEDSLEAEDEDGGDWGRTRGFLCERDPLLERDFLPESRERRREEDEPLDLPDEAGRGVEEDP